MTTPSIKFSTETITPKLAQEILDNNNHGNRPISQKRVAVYAADMRRAKWKVTGETLKFDVNGKLLDGQHRLRGVIEANSTIEFSVARNVPVESFKIIDTGKMRSHGDALAIDGIDHNLSKTIATAATLAITYKEYGLPSHSVKSNNINDIDKTGDVLSNRGVVDYVRANLNLVKEASFIHENWGKTAPMSKGKLCFCLHEIRKVARSDDAADLFILDIIQGTMLHSNDPVYHLRNGLTAARTAGRDMRVEVALAAVSRAWKLRQEGRVMPHKSTGALFRRDWANDQFPKFV